MIYIRVSGRTACGRSDGDPITNESVGYPVEFSFSAEWEELTKIAVFRGSGVVFEMPLINSNQTVIPHEILQDPGRGIMIGVYGANPDGTIAMPTVYVKVGKVCAGAVPPIVSPAVPTPSWAIQVQAAAENTLRDANTAKDVAVAAAAESAGSAVLAESWAVGETDTREGENQNNAKFWAMVAQQGAEHSGYAIFDVNDQDGQMYVTITDPLSGDVSFLVNENLGTLEVTING